jgi:hypothetical protein
MNMEWQLFQLSTINLFYFFDPVIKLTQYDNHESNFQPYLRVIEYYKVRLENKFKQMLYIM